MDIQKEREAFEDWIKNGDPFAGNDAAPDCIWAKKYMWKAWQAKAQEVPENKQFNLDEFLSMEQKLQSKGGIIKADLDRFIAYAEMVLEKAKAHRSQNDH